MDSYYGKESYKKKVKPKAYAEYFVVNGLNNIEARRIQVKDRSTNSSVYKSIEATDNVYGNAEPCLPITQKRLRRILNNS